MSEVLNLLVYLGPFMAWGLVLWVGAELTWAIARWVYGLNTFFGLHRDQFIHLLPVARDKTGNPIPFAPPRLLD